MSEYKSKYLKYKNKYLQLKNNIDGGIHFKSINFGDTLDFNDYRYKIEQIKFIEKRLNPVSDIYKKPLTIKKEDKVIIQMMIYEICENKTFCILSTFENDSETLQLFTSLFNNQLQKVEYIIDETKSIIDTNFDILEMNNENIVFLKGKENFEILKNFNFDKGCVNSYNKYNKLENYSINFIWLSREKNINNCILFKHKTVYSLLNETPQTEEEYVKNIERNIKLRRKQFDYSGYHFDLDKNKYYKIDKLDEFGEFGENIIYVESSLDNIKKWCELHKHSKINLWYDSQLIEINTLIETILLFHNFNESFNESFDGMGIYLRDIRTLESLKSLTYEINPFDKILKDENPDKTLIQRYLPLYYRVDLVRLLILIDELQKYNYALYSDMDITPIDKESLFKQDKISGRIWDIDEYGIKMSFFNGIIENGVVFVGSKYPIKKKEIYTGLYSVAHSSINGLQEYINGDCGDYDYISEIRKQTFHSKDSVNNCMNKLQEDVYDRLGHHFVNIRNEIKDELTQTIENRDFMTIPIKTKPSRFKI
jgi:hypothetical protein